MHAKKFAMTMKLSTQIMFAQMKKNYYKFRTKNILLTSDRMSILVDSKGKFGSQKVLHHERHEIY